jgi:hypothetical protein
MRFDVPLFDYDTVKRCANCKKALRRAHVSHEGEIFCSLQCELTLRKKRKRALGGECCICHGPFEPTKLKEGMCPSCHKEHLRVQREILGRDV